jgi:RND family efflux transporter MFP subunit
MDQTPPRKRKRRWLILPPIALGIGVIVLMAQGRQPPVPAEAGEPAKPVHVLEARALSLRPTAEGHGPVRPASVWTAVAEVSGRIVEIHPRLRDGEILAAGTELARIDPIDYELALAEANAELAELDVQAQNARASLAIEQRNQRLAAQELDRLENLSKRGTVADTDVDQAERTMLGTNTAVQNLQNQLTLIPTQRRLLESRVSRAERDLARTRIVAPFDLRVANRAVEANQYVGVGQTLFEGDSVDRVEMDVQVPLYALRRLFLGYADLDLEPTRISERLAELVGLDPLVRLDLGDFTAEWDAEFVRMDDQVDPETRTMGVVVAVDAPFEKIIPGERPPLSKGMFVQVVLRGRAGEPRVVLPRQAVRGGVVLLVDGEQRLRRRRVEVLFEQDGWSVLAAGIEPGERVVLSDLVPVVEGMLLAPEPDDGVARALDALATAEAGVEP